MLSDFAYTLEIEPLESRSEEDPTGTLEDLLSLLQHADCWNMGDLRIAVSNTIGTLGLIRLETVHAIREAAELANAVVLQQSCEEYERKNYDVLLTTSDN